MPILNLKCKKNGKENYTIKTWGWFLTILLGIVTRSCRIGTRGTWPMGSPCQSKHKLINKEHYCLIISFQDFMWIWYRYSMWQAGSLTLDLWVFVKEYTKQKAQFFGQIIFDILKNFGMESWYFPFSEAQKRHILRGTKRLSTGKKIVFCPEEGNLTSNFMENYRKINFKTLGVLFPSLSFKVLLLLSVRRENIWLDLILFHLWSSLLLLEFKWLSLLVVDSLFMHYFFKQPCALVV